MSFESATARVDAILNDPNNANRLQDSSELRSIVESGLGEPSEANTESWLAFLASYLAMFPPARLSQTSKSCADYVHSLLCTFLDRCGLRKVYADKCQVAAFDTLLRAALELNPALGARSLVDTAKRYHAQLGNSSLTFLDVVTVHHLFLQRDFQKVVNLFDCGPAEDLSVIDPTDMSRQLVLQYYFDIARSLFAVGNRLDDVYTVLQILFELPVQVSGVVFFQELASLYFVLLMLLEKEYNDRDPNLVRFSPMVHPNVGAIFQCYHSGHLAQLARLVYLEYVQRDAANRDTEYLFTLDSVTRLLTIACHRKYKKATGNIYNISDEELDQIDPTAEVRSILDALGIPIDATAGSDADTTIMATDRATSSDLLASITGLAQSNAHLTSTIEETKRGVQLRSFQRSQRRTYPANV